MPSVWISALKEYNEKKGMWCLPKKGSAEHAEVMKIMDRMKGKVAPAAESPKRKLRTEKEKKESEMMMKEDKDAPAVGPKRKLKAKAESDSDSDIPVPKPKVRAEPAVAKKAKAEPAVAKPKAKAEPKAKAPKIVYKGEKFVPVVRTAKEKEERAEKMELELMAEDFKANSPLKKKK